MNDPLQSVGQMAEGAGKVADASSKLVDFFSKVTGVDVRHKVRMAEAEAKAIEIVSHAQMKAELQGAMVRVMTRELYRQRNLTAIVQEALPLLESGSDPAKISEGFINRFANAAEDVSEEDLQKMFAQLLAQEANAPNTVSNRALDIMRTLSSGEAQLVTKLAALVCRMGPDYALVVPDRDKSWFYGLTFEQMVHLDKVGILSRDGLAMGVHPTSAWRIIYFDEEHIFKNNTPSMVHISVYPISWDGLQIVKAAKPEKNSEYIADTVRYIQSRGLEKIKPEDANK